MAGRDLENAVNRLADLVQEEQRERRAERLRKEYRWMDAKPPRRMNLRAWLENVPGLPARFSKRVPAEMFMQVADQVVEVACPCGESHQVGFESLVLAKCGRGFIWDGQNVFVSPEPPSPPDEAPSS